MSDKDEAVLFECSFTKAEIEAVCRALEHYIAFGVAPEGLRPALMSTLKAFHSVKTTGSAV